MMSFLFRAHPKCSNSTMGTAGDTEDSGPSQMSLNNTSCVAYQGSSSGHGSVSQLAPHYYRHECFEAKQVWINVNSVKISSLEEDQGLTSHSGTIGWNREQMSPRPTKKNCAHLGSILISVMTLVVYTTFTTHRVGSMERLLVTQHGFFGYHPQWYLNG